jgi:hypothetical protein
MPSRPDIYGEIRLPGIMIGTKDVRALFKQGRNAGPFLLVSRSCGLALDTAFAVDNGALPIMYPPHGRRQQLWYLEPSGYTGEIHLVSAESGLALDSTVDPNGDKPLLWERNGAAWQRWTLHQAPDNVGYLIMSTLSSRALVANESTQPHWNPWLEDRSGSWAQQWMLSIPHGGSIH